MTRTLRPAAALVASSALALALGGCKVDNRPLLAWGSPAPPPQAGLPGPGPLDPGYAEAPPPTLAAYPAPVRAYAYPQRAYAVSRAVYERPPSYGFDYGGEQPWVWDAADDGMMFGEPVDDGWRYYWYDPGDPYPYFVQDADYGYAYGDDGALIAIFDAAGALLNGDAYDRAAYWGRDWGRRGYDLELAYQRSPRVVVDEQVWRARAPAVFGLQDRWFQAASAQPAWRQAADLGLARAWPHDNGRHLGWYKDHGREVAMAGPPPAYATPPRGDGRPQGWERDRRGGPAPQAFAQAQPRPGWSGPGREHGQEGRMAQLAPPHVEHGRRGGGGPPSQAFARADHQGGWREGGGRAGGRSWSPPTGPAPHVEHEAAFAHGRPQLAQAGGNHGGPDHGGGQGRGGGRQDFAVAAPAHGSNAAWRGPAPQAQPAPQPQGQHGGGPPQGGGGRQHGGGQGGGGQGGGEHGHGHGQ